MAVSNATKIQLNKIIAKLRSKIDDLQALDKAQRRHIEFLQKELRKFEDSIHD